MARACARAPGLEPAPRARFVLPLWAGETRVGTLRLVAPQRARLAWLRRYLDCAGSVLDRHLRARRAERRAERYDALLEHQTDWCVLVLSQSGVIHAIDGNVEALEPGGAPWLGQPLEGAPGRTGPLGLSRTRVRQILASARRNGFARAAP